MTQDQILVDDALLLIEQNFYFLHAGEFFATLSKKKNLSKNNSLQISKTFENNTTYNFNPTIIKEILDDAKNSSEKEITLFEYFVEFNAFRGICMAMVEALRLDTPFRDFMQIKLSGQFENFFDIVSFVRNVLSHNIHAEICLNKKDFEGTLKRIIRLKRDPNIFFEFIYARDLPEIGSPFEDYSIRYNIDFRSLKEGMPFLEVISLWELIMLSELCFNFAISYKLLNSFFS